MTEFVLGKWLVTLYFIAIIGVISIIGVFGVGCYQTYNYFYGNEVIESSKPISPTLKLKINNNKVDTIYVYTLKK